ncbi:zinc ribbon domain-containing protein [Mycoplasmatota bacterium]|nr:zinc ribbon domain-containing protein [Mycoplasmatota bacterium]
MSRGWLFSEVQELLNNRRNGGRFKAKTIYLLSGLIYCKKCGGRLQGNRRKAGSGKKEYASYRCRCKEVKEINKLYIDQYVANLLMETILDENNITKLHKMINKQIKESRVNETSLIASKKKQLHELEKRIDSTVNLMIEDNDARVQKVLMQKIYEMSDVKDLLEEELRTMNVTTDVDEVSLDRVRDIVIGLNDYMAKNPDDRMRALVRKFISKVEVDNMKIEVLLKLDPFILEKSINSIQVKISRMLKYIYRCIESSIVIQ